MQKQNPGCLLGLFSFLPQKSDKKPNQQEQKTKEPAPFLPTYKRKYLLTKNELYFYKELKKVADKLNLTILAKIRMADLVDPKSTGKAYYSEFAKIKAKHVDFALCDPTNLYVLLLIELDDNSHSKDAVAERDTFVQTVYNATGYKLYRARGTATLEKDITELLSQDTKCTKKPSADRSSEG